MFFTASWRMKMRVDEYPDNTWLRWDDEVWGRTDQKVRDAVNAWLYEGINVIPCRNKRVRGDWKGYHNDFIGLPVRNHTNGHSGRDGDYIANIGAVCGRGSDNLFVLDFDNQDVFELWLTSFGERADIYNIISRKTMVESTPHGFHVYFRTDFDPPGNTRYILAPAVNKEGRPVKKALIESRGQGGYVVCAPSYVVKNGVRKEYRICFGDRARLSLARNRVSVDEYNIIVNSFRDFAAEHKTDGWEFTDDKKAADPEKPESTAKENYYDLKYNRRITFRQAGHRGFSQNFSGNLADRLRERTDILEDVLADNGWTQTRSRYNDGVNWTRPGKDVREGTSATVFPDGHIHVFSSSAGLTVGSYSVVQILAYYACDNNMTWATKAARKIIEGGLDWRAAVAVTKAGFTQNYDGRSSFNRSSFGFHRSFC